MGDKNVRNCVVVEGAACGFGGVNPWNHLPVFLYEFILSALVYGHFVSPFRVILIEVKPSILSTIGLVDRYKV